MALDFGNKVENGGIPPNGVLPASEFNQLVAQVNSNAAGIDDLDERLEVAEDSLKGTMEHAATIHENTYIKREPTAEKGDIGNFNNLNLHVFTGLPVGEITIAFSGEDTTSGAQAAGWYPTSVVSEMSHSNFSVVSGLDTWSKNTANKTYTVVVPEGKVLVVSAQGNVTVSVSSTQVGARMDNLEADVESSMERLDTLEDTVEEHESELYIEESNTLEVDEIADGYRIDNTTTDVDTEGSRFFDLYSYKVTAGDKIHIANTSNTQGFTTRVYAFYSNESMTDGEGNVLVGSSTYIAIDSSYNHTWGTAVFDDTLIVPAGAKLLVVTRNRSAESNPNAEVVEKVGVGTAVEEFAEKMEGFSPYKMQAKREGENIYVAYNRGDGVELVYHFGRVFTSTNNVLGLRVVGYRNVNRPNSIASADNITELCNQISSDMFSAPVSLDGVWVGGAHNIDSTPTSVNVSWEVTADGNALTSGVVDCSSVTVTAVNKFSHPTWGDVLEETVVMTVRCDSLDMTVSHNYKYSGAIGRTIQAYYGMMSNAFGSESTNLIKTVAGAYQSWIVQNEAQAFLKGDYPHYCELIARKPNGWKQSMRLDTTNYGTVDGFTYIGDHSLLRDTDKISLAYSEIGTFKLYHVLILGGATVTSGMKYMWKGTYRWWNKNGDVEFSGLADNSCPIIEDTRSSAVAAITGVAPFSELVDGQRIIIHLNNNTVNSTTINLTLSDNTTTDAIPLYSSRNGQVLQVGAVYGLANTYIYAIYSSTNNRWNALPVQDTNTTYGALSQSIINEGTTTLNYVIPAKIFHDNAYIVDIPYTSSITALKANKMYDFGTVSSLTIPSLDATNDLVSNALNFYALRFIAGADDISITFPTGVIVDDEPTINTGDYVEIMINLYVENNTNHFYASIKIWQAQ